LLQSFRYNYYIAPIYFLPTYSYSTECVDDLGVIM